MAVPRPILLAVLGLVLVTATFMATRSTDQASHGLAAAPKQAPKQRHAPKASKPSAQRPSASSHPSARRTHSRNAAPPPAHHHSELAKAAAVSRAIGRGDVVVLAFFQRGADDRAAASAIASLPSEHGVAVFTDQVAHVSRYGSLIQGIGIDQAPAIVIVDHDRRARLIQGYVDAETLAQEVSDARG
jgi:hypothetical protein